MPVSLVLDWIMMFFYWGLFFHTVGIHLKKCPSKILCPLHLLRWGIQLPCFFFLYSSSHPLFPWLPLSSPALSIPFQYQFLNSGTSHSPHIAKPSQSKTPPKIHLFSPLLSTFCLGLCTIQHDPLYQWFKNWCLGFIYNIFCYIYFFLSLIFFSFPQWSSRLILKLIQIVWIYHLS